MTATAGSCWSIGGLVVRPQRSAGLLLQRRRHSIDGQPGVVADCPAHPFGSVSCWVMLVLNLVMDAYGGTRLVRVHGAVAHLVHESHRLVAGCYFVEDALKSLLECVSTCASAQARYRCLRARRAMEPMMRSPRTPCAVCRTTRSCNVLASGGGMARGAHALLWGSDCARLH